MNELLKKFDPWLEDAGPAALATREHLMPVEGPDGVVFPATFAASSFKGGYNVDHFTETENICLIDSVGSQANRIEPLFAKKEYAGGATGRGEGRRQEREPARCWTSRQRRHRALLGVAGGAADWVQGGAKWRRCTAGEDRAYLPRFRRVGFPRHPSQAAPADRFGDPGVQRPPANAVGPVCSGGGVHQRRTAGRTARQEDEGCLRRTRVRTRPGFRHPGGVTATGGIRRDSALHLAALRLLAAGKDEAKTLKLRRYILGLALTAFTYSPSGYLRQGCNLVLDPGKPRDFVKVYGDGRRLPASVTHAEALEYARASDFGVGENRSVEFDKERAKRDVSGDVGGGDGKARKSRSKTAL
jgi:CRISPR-associated protein Csb1